MLRRKISMKNFMIFILYINVFFTPAQGIAQMCQSTIECILERDKIVAGVKYDARPFGFWDEKTDQIAGFDIDLVRAFAQCWLGDENKVEFIQVTSKDRIKILQERYVDMIVATMTHTTEREKEIDFSQTYFLDGQRLLVHSRSDLADITANDRFEDYATRLQGKTVAAVQATTSLENIRNKMIQNGFQVNLDEFRTYPDALQALLAGDVDAVTADGSILWGFVEKKHLELRVVGKAFSEEPYGIGVYKGDDDLQRLINLSLQGLMTNGKYQEIFRRWFPDEDTWPLYKIQVLPGKQDFSEFEEKFGMKIRCQGPSSQNTLTSPPVPTVAACPPEMQLMTTDKLAFCLDIREATEHDVPLVGISWTEADTYCRKQGKRLPTREEWNVAVDSEKGLIQGIDNEIKEWIDAEDDTGRKFYRPFDQNRDPPLFSDERYKDIGFRCAQ